MKVIQDIDKSISVMQNASRWMKYEGIPISKWWDLKNLNKKFLVQYAKTDEFYCVLVDSNPAAAAILQMSQSAQDWKNVDKNTPKPALYIHWLCVSKDFRGKQMPKVMIDFAGKLAKENNVRLLRADTNSEVVKLRKIYENLGFKLVAEQQEDYRKTAFYEKKV
ncbi:MAG: GNAT family N-acetyltransferase [Candidatus Aenigmarchaeota archaeon]|nr:GNAT family N-acetyltransferase [Candidatus Aenigmarchaeota archaeon]